MWYNKEINAGSFKGIPVKLHMSFILLLFIEVLASFRVVKVAPVYLFFVLVLYGPVLYFTVLIHELGHVRMAEKLGGTVEKLVLWPLGGLEIYGPSPSYGVIGDLKVAVAGPLTHFIQMIVWLVCYAIFAGGDFEFFQAEIYLDIMTDGFSGFMSVLSAMAFYMNLFVFALNFFIPAYPLDGGRCMVATLTLLGVPLRHAAQAKALTAMGVAAILGLLGLISFFGEKNPNGFITTLISIYIFVDAKNLYVLAITDRANDHPLFNRACYDDREVTIEQVIHETEENNSDNDDKPEENGKGSDKKDIEIVGGNFA